MVPFHIVVSNVRPATAFFAFLSPTDPIRISFMCVAEMLSHTFFKYVNKAYKTKTKSYIHTSFKSCNIARLAHFDYQARLKRNKTEIIILHFITYKVHAIFVFCFFFVGFCFCFCWTLFRNPSQVYLLN